MAQCDRQSSYLVMSIDGHQYFSVIFLLNSEQLGDPPISSTLLKLAFRMFLLVIKTAMAGLSL